MNFKKWTKPGTNEIRVYISGTDKAYIKNTDGRWDVVAYGLYTSQKDQLMDLVESELAELNGGERFWEFSKVLELVA